MPEAAIPAAAAGPIATPGAEVSLWKKLAKREDFSFASGGFSSCIAKGMLLELHKTFQSGRDGKSLFGLKFYPICMLRPAALAF